MSSSEYGPGEESLVREPVVTQADITSPAESAETPVEQTPAESDVTPVEQTTEETRWDHDKAEDVAHALSETKKWEDGSKRIDLAIRQATEPRHVAYREDQINKLTERIAHLQAQREGEVSGNNDPIEIKKIDDDLIEARGYLNIEKNGDKERIDHQRTMLHYSADRVIDRYGRVYDMNPEAFAALPTSEFMEIAKQITNAEHWVSHIDSVVGELNDTAALVRGYIENRRAFSKDSIKLIEDRLAKSRNGQADAETGIMRRYDILSDLRKIYTDTFDKSDHQVWDEIAAFISSEASKATEVDKPALMARVQRLHSQYGKPEQAGAGEPNAPIDTQPST